MPAGIPAHRCALACLSLPLLLASALGGQTDAPERDHSFSESVSVEQVLVPVVVRKGPRFVEGLGVKRFSLFVDNEPTSITSFEHSSGAPVHTLVLQDLSGSMGGHPKLELSREILARLLANGRPGDLYSLATFAASGVVVEAEPTADPAVIDDWTAGWQAFGRTGIHDAVSRIPNLISADSAWRSAVLLITDGVDNASAISARDARMIARRAEVPVHIVALLGRPERTEETESWSSDPLRLLSWVTGGRFHSIEAPDSVKVASEAFMSELRSQYILGFQTSGAGEARPRSIRVEVRGRGRKIAFRREYYGTRPGTRAGSDDRPATDRSGRDR